MRRWRKDAAPCDEDSTRVFLLLPPRDGALSLQAQAETLGALECAEGVGLEIAGRSGEGVRFTIRAPSAARAIGLAAHLRGAYPQGALLPVDPPSDPLVDRPGEGVEAREIHLVEEPYVPLRAAYEDGDGDSRAITSLFGKLRGLPPGLDAVCQLALWPAPAGWGAEAERRLERRQEESSRAARSRTDGQSAPSLLPILTIGALAVVGAMMRAPGARPLRGLNAPLVFGGAIVILVALLFCILVVRARFSGGRAEPDPSLLRERLQVKGAARLFSCRLRILVRGGSEAERAAALGDLCSVYAGFSSLVGDSCESWPCEPEALALLQPARGHFAVPRPVSWLNAREVAALWKVPDAAIEAPGLMRAGPRVLFPSDDAFSAGLRLGHTRGSGHSIPVHLPRAALDRHTIVTGATGSGKSTWVQTLLHAALQAQGPDTRRLQVVVIDPHSTLIQGILGWYGEVRRQEPAVVRLADVTRPVGYNPLDVTGGRRDGQIIGGLTTGFSRQWDGTWGSRMEMVFRQACTTLLRANRTLPPEAQYTLLDVNPLLLNGPFLQSVLRRVDDVALSRYWRDQYVDLSKSLRDQVITPVTSKMSRFEEETAASILGQPQSTLSITAAVRDGIDLFIDSDAYGIGVDSCSILDSLFIHAVADAIRERGACGVRTLLIVDEAQHAPVVWESIMTSVRAFGGSVILMTQVTAALETMGVGVRAAVMGNVGTKVCFRAAESVEAEYMARELGEEVLPRDVQDLPDRRAYMKTTDGRRQLPLVSLDTAAPPRGDREAAAALIDASAGRYGTPIEGVRARRQEWVRSLFLGESAVVGAGS